MSWWLIFVILIIFLFLLWFLIGRQRVTQGGGGASVYPQPGPIIIINPNPNPSGNHWSIDNLDASSYAETGAYNNSKSFGPVLEFVARVMVGGQEQTVEVKIMNATFAGNKNLVVDRVGGGAGSFRWTLDGTMLNPRVYPTNRSWRSDLCGAIVGNIVVTYTDAKTNADTMANALNVRMVAEV